MAPSFPNRLGPYRLEALLGRGGMGSVHRAIDTRTNVAVALKLVLPELARDARFVERFRREGRLGMTLRHENVASVLDVGEEAGYLYLTLELLPGGSLRDRLRRADHLPWREAAQLGAQIARGLAVIHGAGLIHRDLKPANVLVAQSGALKIADLGLVRRVDAAQSHALTRTGELLGSFDYLSPEQADGSKEISGATDLYALGATLLEMLTGRPPFQGPALTLLKRHLLETPDAPSARVPGIAPAFDALVLRLLAKEPGDRGPGALAVADELEAIAASQAPAPRSRARSAAIVALGLAAVAGTGAALAARGSGPAPPPSAGAGGGSSAIRSGTGASRRVEDPRLAGTPEWFRALLPREQPKFPLPSGLDFGPAPGEYVNAKDGSVLVYVPAAAFDMGVSEKEQPGEDDRVYPRRRVSLSAYFIGKFEVSVREFGGQARSRTPTKAETDGFGHYVERHSSGKLTEEPHQLEGASWQKPWAATPAAPNEPATQVTWSEASAYCEWAGLVLPTEAQWERAARWDADAGRSRVFPWGDSLPEAGRRVANVADLTLLRRFADFVKEVSLDWREPAVCWEELRYDDGFALAAPVTEMPAGASPVGALNMIGNVAEWCRDAYRPDAYRTLPLADPLADAPESASEGSGAVERSVRGGSYLTSSVLCTTWWRDSHTQGSAFSDVGFRVARAAK